MIVYGRNPIKELLTSGKTIEKLYIEKNLNSPSLIDTIKLAKERKTVISYADKLALDKLSKGGNHQGLVAITSEYEYFELEDILTNRKGEDAFVLILDGIEDPHNLGSILRVADSAGVDGVIIPKRRAVGVSDTVYKVSAGAAEHTKIAKVTNINDTIRQLKKDGFTVFSVELGGQSVYSANLSGNIALVIGSEGTGISRLTKELSDGIISLPQYGKINSLNASVATGIVCYEAVRQRNNLK